MLQPPVCEAQARESESIEAAGRSLMQMVVRTPVMLPQSSMTLLLPDG